MKFDFVVRSLLLAYDVCSLHAYIHACLRSTLTQTATKWHVTHVSANNESLFHS